MKSNVFLGQLKMQGHNIEWLLNQMAERGVSITKSTIYKKLRGESEFNASEIKVISGIMQYNEKEMYDIFLKNWCPKRCKERNEINEHTANF